MALPRGTHVVLVVEVVRVAQVARGSALQLALVRAKDRPNVRHRRLLGAGHWDGDGLRREQLRVILGAALFDRGGGSLPRVGRPRRRRANALSDLKHWSSYGSLRIFLEGAGGRELAGDEGPLQQRHGIRPREHSTCRHAQAPHCQTEERGCAGGF